MTDRALRHLLTDITGNTHRAEFCIDKLYNPDSPRGRLGLLELRGFEMPPHFQMAMVQSLLVRSLVAWFWDEPLRAPLIRHGANLHGRYLLPHFLIHDIADVAADLRAHDVNFDTSWLDPFTEFRFPRIGTAVFDGVEIELRGAIEPWNVLGEESSVAGTARYVDSSIERIQVRTIGADRQRYVVTANGYPVPLLATDNPDIQVGGVRFRAWQPPSAMHPTITVDGPLRFELVDTASGASRGGCTYHVSHPGGRSVRHSARQRGGGRVEARPPVRGDRVHPRSRRHLRHSREAGTPIHRRGRAGHTRPAPGAYRSALMALPAANPHDIDNLLAGYRAARAQQALFEPRGGAVAGYDEFVDAAGNVRPSWVELADCVGERGRVRSRAIARGGSQPRRQRRHHLRQVDTNGEAVTNGDGDRRTRAVAPRRLPILISATDWDTLESGLCNDRDYSTRYLPTCTVLGAR